MLLATYRSDELHRRHPGARVPHRPRRRCRADRAGSLRRRRARAAPDRDLGEAPAPELAARLLARSEGNAFLAEELLAAGGSELPDTLREAMLGRVERVSEGAKLALRVAACAGASVPHRLLSATAGLPELELEDALREAVTHQVLVRSGDDAYAFRHALLGEAVYADVLPGERARIHAAIARALEHAPDLASDGGAVAAAELAHHWKAAHELAEALAASVGAGRAAARIAEYPEAQRHFEYALDVWDRVADAEERAGMDRIDLTPAPPRRRSSAAIASARSPWHGTRRPGSTPGATRSEPGWCTSAWAATSGSWAAATRQRRPTATQWPRCRPIRQHRTGPRRRRRGPAADAARPRP